MNHLTTDLIEALAQKQNIEEVFRHHLETAINQLLKHELTVFLDDEPYDREGFHSGNSRNELFAMYLFFKTKNKKERFIFVQNEKNIFKAKLCILFSFNYLKMGTLIPMLLKLILSLSTCG